MMKQNLGILSSSFKRGKTMKRQLNKKKGGKKFCITEKYFVHTVYRQQVPQGLGDPKTAHTHTGPSTDVTINWESMLRLGS